ncbi:MAG: hypothetical protein F4X97_09915 [Boseongicola sp. SB0662_bin_57]|nr:hypothetical protein [Boseongicola sp. SB0662_bin_57]
MFDWTPPADFDLAGIIIRRAPDPNPDSDVNDVEWGVMEPMHLGVLTASPWETTNPPEGDWLFAARALSTAGDLSEIVRFKASLGPGPQGLAGLTQREFIYALTATGDPIPESKRPQNSWSFDNPGTADGLRWTDGQEGVTLALPVAWQSSRAVPITAEAGDEISDEWTVPVVVAQRGLTPEDGEDGQGYEFIFAKTSSASAPAAPNNAWGYDQPQSPWSDGAPVIALGEYLWMAQRRIVGAPAAGDAVPASWTSPRSISRVAMDGEDGVTTTITRTETVPLGQGAVQTGNIALSATAEVDGLFGSSSTLSTRSIAGGAGYSYLVQAVGNVTVDDVDEGPARSGTVTLRRGSTTIGSASFTGRRDSSGSHLEPFGFAVDGSHTSAATFSLTRSGSGVLGFVRCEITVFVAKR